MLIKLKKNVLNQIEKIKKERKISKEVDKKILSLYWDVYLKIMEFEKSKENV